MWPMDEVSNLNQTSGFWQKIQDYRIHHILYWIFIFIIIYFSSSSISAAIFLFISLLAVVYFNLNYLIPKYLPNEFVKYTVLLAIICFLVAPITLSVHSLFVPGKAAMSNAIVFFLMIFFLAGTSTVMKITKNWFQEQQQSIVREKASMQTELKFLKSQINPHFLFNTLNNLYALTLKKSDKAPDIVIKLSEMMRYMLYECNEKRVPLRKEIKYLQNYLDLEELRQGDRANISVKIEGRIDDQKIAPLMFIPFLENSFKHGVNNRIGKGYVNTTIKVDRNKLHFTIINSKPPPTPTPGIRKVGGIGLMNVKRRLNLIYPDAHDLTIEDHPKEYIVHLELDLDK